MTSAKACSAAGCKACAADNIRLLKISFSLAALACPVFISVWNAPDLKPELFPGTTFKTGSVIVMELKPGSDVDIDLEKDGNRAVFVWSNVKESLDDCERIGLVLALASKTPLDGDGGNVAEVSSGENVGVGGMEGSMSDGDQPCEVAFVLKVSFDGNGEDIIPDGDEKYLA